MRHAAETYGRYRHGDHGDEQRSNGMSVRKDLPFSKKWYGGNRRRQDYAVVDQVPQTQDSFEVRLSGCAGLSHLRGRFHPGLFPLAQS